MRSLIAFLLGRCTRIIKPWYSWAVLSCKVLCLQEAGSGALSSPLLGPLHLRVTTLTSLSQFRPKLPPANPENSGTAHHSQEARQHPSGEEGSPVRGHDGLQGPAAVAWAQSSSSSLSGSEASDSSSHRSSPSTVHVRAWFHAAGCQAPSVGMAILHLIFCSMEPGMAGHCSSQTVSSTALIGSSIQVACAFLGKHGIICRWKCADCSPHSSSKMLARRLTRRMLV